MRSHIEDDLSGDLQNRRSEGLKHCLDPVPQGFKHCLGPSSISSYKLSVLLLRNL